MTYTLYPDLFRLIKEIDDSIYIRDLITIFGISTNSHKIAKDSHGIVIDIYSNTESIYKDFFATFLDMIARNPSGFENIDVDISQIECEETKFITLCKATLGCNVMILYSIQNIKKYKIINNKLNFEDTEITILDRDEARVELNKSKIENTTYNNSQIAINSSTISDSKNNS